MKDTHTLTLQNIFFTYDELHLNVIITGFGISVRSTHNSTQTWDEQSVVSPKNSPPIWNKKKDVAHLWPVLHLTVLLCGPKHNRSLMLGPSSG